MTNYCQRCIEDQRAKGLENPTIRHNGLRGCDYCQYREPDLPEPEKPLYRPVQWQKNMEYQAQQLKARITELEKFKN